MKYTTHHAVEVEHGRLDEALSQVVDDKRGDADADPVRPQRANKDHPLQLRAGRVPLACTHTTVRQE